MVEEKKVDERRNFFGPDEVTLYYIAPPNAEDIRGADWHYSKTYTKCLVEGITTSAEMMDILMRRGIIGPEFEQRAEELTRNLSEKVVALESASSVDDKRDLAIDVANSREELFQWNQRLNGPMNNTCEQISDDARLEYLTSCMIQEKDGSRVWPTYEDYLKTKQQGLSVRARFEVMLFLQGLDSNFLEQTPEALAMREVEDEVIKRAEEAVKAVEAMAKEEEEKAAAKADKPVEKKPKAKRAPRKKPTKKTAEKDE